MYCSVSGISVQSVESVSIPCYISVKRPSHSVYCSVSGISVQSVESVSIPCYISVKRPSHSVYCSVSGISVQSVEFVSIPLYFCKTSVPFCVLQRQWYKCAVCGVCFNTLLYFCKMSVRPGVFTASVV